MSNCRVALVTGISSGIGREIAQLLVEQGFRVFGTAREPHRVKAFAVMDVVELDVTNSASIEAAVKIVLQKAGLPYALVNNTGYALVGALEETRLEEAREQFETNFFGAMRMVNAVLPIMRKQGTGRIVNISSVLGVIPAPYMGIWPANMPSRAVPKPLTMRSGSLASGFLWWNWLYEDQPGCEWKNN